MNTSGFNNSMSNMFQGVPTKNIGAGKGTFVPTAAPNAGTSDPTAIGPLKSAGEIASTVEAPDIFDGFLEKVNFSGISFGRGPPSYFVPQRKNSKETLAAMLNFQDIGTGLIAPFPAYEFSTPNKPSKFTMTFEVNEKTLKDFTMMATVISEGMFPELMKRQGTTVRSPVRMSESTTSDQCYYNLSVKVPSICKSTGCPPSVRMDNHTLVSTPALPAGHYSSVVVTPTIFVSDKKGIATIYLSLNLESAVYKEALGTQEPYNFQ